MNQDKGNTNLQCALYIGLSHSIDYVQFSINWL